MEIEKDIELCINVLKNGGLILYPTDTIWGIGCDATNEVAVNKIFALKKRSDAKAMIVLLTNRDQVGQYVLQPGPKIFDYLNKVKNPTTVIYDKGINVASNLLSADGSLAIRIVKDYFCEALIDKFHKPVVSTSANISGHQSPVLFNDISSIIKDGVDYIAWHRRGDVTVNEPSKIIKLEDDGRIVVIRK